MNFTTNDFVQWTGTDEDGKYSHIGEVINCTDDRIEFATSNGVMNVPTDDGHFRHISRPQGWSTELPKATKKPVKTAHIKPTVKKTTPPPAKLGSKKEKALDFYKLMMDNDSHPKRGDVIEKFMTDLDMTKAGASTYQVMCKKAHS